MTFRVVAWCAIFGTLLPATLAGGDPAVQASADGASISATPALLELMRRRAPIIVDTMPLPDGTSVSLTLEPIRMRMPRVVRMAPDGTRLGLLPSPVVHAFSGTVVGEPDSRAFLGWDGFRLHGWIQTHRGLDVIGAKAGAIESYLYRVGGEGASTAIVHRVDGRRNVPTPANEYERLLQDIAAVNSPLRPQFTSEQFLNLVNRAAGADEDLFEPKGACCVVPGFCYQLDEAFCATICNDSSVVCDNLGPSETAPCWLGETVGCDSRWACFEENEDGGWVGACCYPDPDNPQMQLMEDKPSCECALLGGTFMVEPANCLSGVLPQDYGSERFISAEVMMELDPEACIKPSGACCIDQDLLCIPDLPDLPLPLDQVTCMMLPQGMCESDDPKVLTALNASVPGVFTRECFPCIYDTGTFGPFSDAPPICQQFVVERVDPDEGDYTAIALLEPPNFRCTPLQITLELDAWMPDLFAMPGDPDGMTAATGYATLLFAAVADLYINEARVPIVLDELIMIDPIDNPMGDGACCMTTDSISYCWENANQTDCETEGGEWHGHGSSCYMQPCGDVPVYGGGQAPGSIDFALQQLRERWIENIGACCLSDELCEDLTQDDCAEQGGVFATGFDCGGYSCTDGQGAIFRSMIIGLAAQPFLNQWYPEIGSSAGLYPARGVVEEVGGACKPFVRFGVAPIRGGFAPPPNDNQLGNAQWDFVMLTQVMTRLLGISMTDDYGYDDCYTRYCRGMGAKVDCDLLWADPVAWAMGDMASTIMSNCLACEGELANLQMRFRSEIAARIYATAAAAPCMLDGAVQEEAIANSDVFLVPTVGPSTLDVLFNDVPAGCQVGALAEEPVTLLQDSDGDGDPPGGLPLCTSDPDIGVVTQQNGRACIDEDIDGNQFVRYTPPEGFCGVDRFDYAVVDGAEEALATVSLVSEGGSSFGSECAVSHVIICDPDCPESEGEAVDLPVPPQPGAANVIQIDATALAGIRVDSIRWQDMQLDVLIESSHAAHATLRFWFTSDAASTELDIYWDIIPYGDTIAIQCHDGPVPLGLAGTPGVQPPVSGVCSTPGGSGLMYVPFDGQVLVQCFEQLDEDNTQVDALWIGGTLCLGASGTSTPGACCLGGLCIEVTSSECASLTWAYDFDAQEWYDDPIASGFFMGAGTTCDQRDWCQRQAPCCLSDMCITTPPANCVALGGTTLSGTYGPLWDTPCAFNVCGLNLADEAKGACCVTTDTGLRFCTDVTRPQCDALVNQAPIGSTWETSWQVRATCEYTPCGSTNWDAGGGDGACCFADACCTTSLTSTDCSTAGGIWLAAGSCDDCLVNEEGICCLGPFGPFPLGSGVSTCVNGISAQACESGLGGTWYGGLDDCTDGPPCAVYTPGDACCIGDICINLYKDDCRMAGGRIIRGGTCASPGVCESGVCCVNVIQMAFEAVDEARCEDWGGRWIGSGICIYNRAFDGADLTGDGRIDLDDLLVLLEAWGTRHATADLDRNGDVGLSDLLLLLSAWSP
jgi:hypothetical protein